MLREKQARLLLALREIEDKGEKLSLSDLVSALVVKTGYKAASVRTYISKRLMGNLVHEVEDSAYCVRGAELCAEEDFLRLMSQKLEVSRGLSIGDESQWSSRVRQLAEMGKRCGYKLKDRDAELVLGLFA